MAARTLASWQLAAFYTYVMFKLKATLTWLVILLSVPRNSRWLQIVTSSDRRAAD